MTILTSARCCDRRAVSGVVTLVRASRHNYIYQSKRSLRGLGNDHLTNYVLSQYSSHLMQYYGTTLQSTATLTGYFTNVVTPLKWETTAT